MTKYSSKLSIKFSEEIASTLPLKGVGLRGLWGTGAGVVSCAKDDSIAACKVARSSSGICSCETVVKSEEVVGLFIFFFFFFFC
jgi:hypothetical protein